MKLILPNHRIPKSDIHIFINQVYSNDISISELFANIKQDDRERVLNALWILREISPKYGSIILSYFENLIKLLEYFREDEAVIRNVISIFQNLEFNDPNDGIVLEYAFKYLQENRWAIAVKVFSMTVAFNICKKYPELLTDLKLLIEDNLKLFGPESPAIRSRGNKLLKTITRHLRI